jgi:hypothetical protein
VYESNTVSFNKLALASKRPFTKIYDNFKRDVWHLEELVTTKKVQAVT